MPGLLDLLFPRRRTSREAKAVTHALVEVVRIQLLPLGYNEITSEGMFVGSRFVTDTSYFSLGFDLRDFEFVARMRPPGTSGEPLPPHAYQYAEPYSVREVFSPKESLIPHKARLEARVAECLKLFLPHS